MSRRVLALLLAGSLIQPHVSAALDTKNVEADKTEASIEGYSEWREGDALIVDGQRVMVDKSTRFDLARKVDGFEDIPLGYEIKVKGTRRGDGAIVARELEAKPNGIAMFEKKVLTLTDQAEAKYRRAGKYYVSSKGRRQKVVGKLYDSGPDVDRVRRIADRIVPPYIRPGDVRVYVIENKEWNAFAMGNFSIYVFTGLLNDMDDDELAIVLGHEIAHATHEHTRRQFKKTMWIQIAAIGVTAAAEEKIDDKKKRALLGLMTTFMALALRNGYGRELEDQADRVGLRYAYEAGYDVTRGPGLWKRFAGKYKESGKAANFFFSNHSLSSVRAANLTRELGLNYREGPKHVADPPRRVSRPEGSSRMESASGSAGKRDEIRRGMTPAQVREILGRPKHELSFGDRLRWRYEDVTVIFEDGRVKEVRF
jgi:Zn-dependent protease with chaperone function